MSETVSDKPFDPANHLNQGFAREYTANKTVGSLYNRGSVSPFLDPVETEVPHYKSPEGLSHQDCIAKFYEAWKIPEDVERRQYGEFYNISVQAKDKLIDQTMTPRFSEVMRQYQWLYFGSKPDLPAGTAIISRYGQGRFSRLELISTELITSPNDPWAVNQQLYEKGLQKIDDERAAIRMANLNVVDRYLDVITTSPQYLFLKSFAPTESRRDERALTAAEKQLEVNNAEADIRLHFGLADTARISDYPTSEPRQALAKKLYMIDDKTLSVKTKNDSPVLLAKVFFLEDIKQWANAALGVEYSNVVVQSLLSNTPDLTAISVYARSARSLNERIGATDGDIFEGERLISGFIRGLFSERAKNRTLDDCLGFALGYLNIDADRLTRVISERSLSADQVVTLRGGANCKYANLRHEDNNIKPMKFFEFPDANFYFLESRAEITSRHDYAAEANHVMANIEYGPRNNDTAHRLIEFEPAGHSMFNSARFVLERAPIDEFDLKLTFDTPNQQLGRIAGYKLTAVRDQEMYFTKSLDNDPCRQPDRQLNENERQTIEHGVAEMGATQLAKVLRKSKQLTLFGLVDAIRQTSDYTFDTEINQTESMVPGVGLMAGRLQMQCDGAAVVLSRLLSSIGHEAKIVTGLYASPLEATVSAMRHAQVSWFDVSDVKYRLDATPGGVATGQQSNSQLAGRRGRSIGRLLGRRNELVSILEQRPTGPLLAAEPQMAPVYKLVEAKPPEKLAAEVLDRINLQLKAMTGARNSQDLYKKAINLSKADPVRQTILAVLRVQKQSIEEPDLVELEAYLSNLHKADAQFLKRRGIPKYQSGTLQMLQSFVQQLSSLTKV